MNKHIIVAVVVIGGTGFIRAFTSSKPVTPVIIGSYVLLLVLSLADAVGGGVSQIASGIAMVAMVYVLLTQFPWSTLINAVNGSKSAAAGGAGAGGGF